MIRKKPVHLWSGTLHGSGLHSVSEIFARRADIREPLVAKPGVGSDPRGRVFGSALGTAECGSISTATGEERVSGLSAAWLAGLRKLKKFEDNADVDRGLGVQSLRHRRAAGGEPITSVATVCRRGGARVNKTQTV